MPLNRIDSFQPSVQVAATRQQQVAPPRTPFANVLATGGQVLLAGAALTAGVVGGPVLAMAVTTAGNLGRSASPGAHPSGSVVGIEGSPTPSSVPDPTPSGTSGPAPSGNTPAQITSAGGGGTDVAAMRAMNQENFRMNSQLMQLQEEVQSENRRFSTLTNVLRARHDTAKAAVSNIRS